MEPQYCVKRITSYHHTETRMIESLHPEERAAIARLLHPELEYEENLQVVVDMSRSTGKNLVRAVKTGAVFIIHEYGSMLCTLGIATLVDVHTVKHDHIGLMGDFAIDRNREHTDRLALAEALMRPLIEYAKTSDMTSIVAEPEELYQHQTYDNFGFTAEGQSRRMRLNLKG